jgi:8-oxo-dGTP pyrophosphatase MutT (NUDIX family)
VTATVLLHREGRWLLTVRSPDVDDAAGQLGLVGGHVEHPVAGHPGVLEDTARREAAEEVGLDLGAVALTYLESEFFTTDTGTGQVTVAFLAAAPPDQEPVVADPAELTAVGWWTPDEAGADERCPAWLPALLRRAALAVPGGQAGSSLRRGTVSSRRPGAAARP